MIGKGANCERRSACGFEPAGVIKFRRGRGSVAELRIRWASAPIARPDFVRSPQRARLGKRRTSRLGLIIHRSGSFSDPRGCVALGTGLAYVSDCRDRSLIACRALRDAHCAGFGFSGGATGAGGLLHLGAQPRFESIIRIDNQAADFGPRRSPPLCTPISERARSNAEFGRFFRFRFEAGEIRHCRASL